MLLNVHVLVHVLGSAMWVLVGPGQYDTSTSPLLDSPAICELDTICLISRRATGLIADTWHTLFVSAFAPSASCSVLLPLPSLRAILAPCESNWECANLAIFFSALFLTCRIMVRPVHIDKCGLHCSSVPWSCLWDRSSCIVYVLVCHTLSTICFLLFCISASGLSCWPPYFQTLIWQGTTQVCDCLMLASAWPARLLLVPKIWIVAG